MKKGIIIGCMVAFVLMTVGLAHAEVQNIKVSGDILMRVISRQDWSCRDSGDTGTAVFNVGTPPGNWEDTNINDKRDNFMTTVRLRIDADLTDNVSTVVRLINERDWDRETAATTDIDLDLAYVQLKEFFYSPLSMTIGRQELHYGSELCIGDPDTNQMDLSGASAIANDDLSLRKSFDAIRGVLSYDPWTIDLVYAKIDENEVFTSDDENLYGINTAYDFGTYNSIGESYIYYIDRQKLTVDRQQAVASTTSAKDDVLCMGGRLYMEPIENLTFSVEGAHQTGHYAGQQNLATTLNPGGIDTNVDVINNNNAALIDEGGARDAWAAQVITDYTWTKNKYVPKMSLSYTYLSGDEAARNGGEYTGWDPMYENQSAGIISNALFVASNCHIASASISATPIEDLNAKLLFSYFWLDKELGITSDSLTNYRRLTDQGTFVSTQVKETANDLGYEFDLCMTYDYTEDVQFGLDSGIFVPGSVLGEANREPAYTCMGSMKVTF